MKKTSSGKFDLCVFGCGAAGFAAAMRAIDFGKRVCIVENDEIGGAAVKWGALASKTMWELAKDYDVAAKTDRGYRAQSIAVDYGMLRNTVIQAVKERQYQMRSQIETYSLPAWKGEGSLEYKRGRGSFLSKNRARIAYPDGDTEEVYADNFLVATGSTPRAMPNIRIDQERIIDSDGVLNLKSFPKRLVIIGAGIVGCEYAAIFSNFKQTKVYLVDHQDRIIPFEDEDVSEFVSKRFRLNGVEIFHSARVRTIDSYDDHLEVILDFEDGRAQVLEADAALLSIGRVPNLAGLRLDKAGIETDGAGFLKADENCRVEDNVYAAGDVLKHPALVNIAEMEGRYAVKHMFGTVKWPLNYHNMSTVMFFKPAVAAVGINEKNCRKRKIPYRVAYYSNALLSRAIAMRATDGFVKIIVSDDDDQRILGMRAAGPQVSTTIMSLAVLMDQNKALRDVLKSIHPHPTMSEGIKECLRVLRNKSIFKGHAFPDLIEIRTWKPSEEE